MTERRLRPSSLIVYLDCPRRWAATQQADLIAAYGYKLQLERPTHVGACVGSGVHAGAGYTLAEKRLTGELGNASEAEDRAVQEMRERMHYGVSWDGTTSDLTTAQKQVARMTRSYRAHLAPQIVPMVIEERLEADIGEGWILSGQPDTMAGDPQRDIRDLKTGVRRRANAVQYGAYYILLQAHGYQPVTINEDFLRRVRMDKEQPPPESHSAPLALAVADALEAVDDIKRSVRRFEDRAKGDTSGRAPQTAFRANPNSQLCGAKWCRAWGTDFCQAHTKEG